MTKSFQIFDGKMRSLKQHLQLIDLSLNSAKHTCMSNKDNGLNLAATLKAQKGTHLQLNIPNNSKEINRVIAFSRKKLNEQALVELYRLFSDYISNIVGELFKDNPFHILGAISNKDERTMYYHEIVKLGDYNAVVNEMIKRIFRSFENQRSTQKLLDKIISITKIHIPEEIKKEALLYLEIRHLIIHNNSNVDEKFNKRDGMNIIQKKNNKIIMNYALANESITSVFKLCKLIDDELVVKGFISSI